MLYRGVEECVKERMRRVAQQLQATSDASLLDSLVSCWDDHKLKMGMLKDILMYMDKTYCSQMNLLPIYERGMLLFRDGVIRAPTIAARIKSTMMDWVRREREGELIDGVVLHHVALMLVECNLSHLDLYHILFESPLLSSTRRFFQLEAQSFLHSSSVPDYLLKIEMRIHEEERRSELYFHPSSKIKLKQIIQEELIVKHAERLINDSGSGGVCMLKNQEVEHMARLYALLAREPKTLEGLRKTFAQVVTNEAMTIVQDRDGSANAADSNSSSSSSSSSATATSVTSGPRRFVERLLSCRRIYLSFVEFSFHSDRSFGKVLKESLEHCLNQDTRTALAIALYTDDILRKQSAATSAAMLTDQELEEKLNEIISLFRYLQDKDLFEEYYKQHLSKRLLDHSSSSSSDVERLMIAKLKSECGHQFTSRLEGMFRDIDLSKQIMTRWKEGEQQLNNGCELSVSVLTTGFWPLPSVPQCNLPAEAKLACDAFTRFYIAQHSGRKLTWHTSLGQAELRCIFDGGRKELVVHTYQMCILMLFNSGDKLSFSDIQRSTNIPPSDLTRHLLSLAHPQVKVLLKNPPGKSIGPDHRFKYNNKYASKLFRNKIPVLSKAAVASVTDGTNAAGSADSSASASSASIAADSSNASAASSSSSSSSSSLPASVLESRKYSVEASIVRIMKSRKTLDHASLVGEVLKQLSSKFPVDPAFVKKRIEALIEREYIERDANNRRVYNYKA